MLDLNKKKRFAIAFYNPENLFDIRDDQVANDNEYLPNSTRKWTYKRYQNKLRKLGFAISRIGENEDASPPVIVGLSEVENGTVVQDLIQSQHLEAFNYGFVHYNSPDERGIDVALIYRKDFFHVTHSEAFSVEIYDEDGLRDYTRDILLVSGYLEGEKIHVLVNHWPSRREGIEESEVKRMVASNKILEIMTQIQNADEDAQFIIMGDFNDEPINKSIRNLINHQDLYNPMERIMSYSRGTTRHGFSWNLFDQILISTSFLDRAPNSLSYQSANIFDEDFLKLFKGPFKGEPFRTYVGTKYKGGYSDHFPVYLILEK